MSADPRLATARSLLDAGPTCANWARWICWTTRLAVENAVRDLWAGQCPEVAGASMRGQLLALRVHAEADTAARTSALWSALSHAAHHHAYDLPPSLDDLRLWITEAEHLVEAIRITAPPR